MEKWKSYKDIALSSECEILEVLFNGRELFIKVRDDGKHKKIYFEDVYAYKYVVEIGTMIRWDQLDKAGRIEKGNWVFTVENSDYVKEFDEQTCGARPIDDVVHYVIMDPDNVVEVLAVPKPVIEG